MPQMNQPSIVFFSPYLTQKHAGGGEKHLFDTAMAVSELGARVFVAISDLGHKRPLDLDSYRKFYQHFIGQNLDQLEFITTPLMSQASRLQKLAFTRQFDQLYYVTDGSLFFSLARKNHLHIQTPLIQSETRLIDRLKLRNWQLNTNSYFTKRVIETYWQKSVSLVHYPLVDLDQFKPKRPPQKQNLILSVGRFFKQLHSKRQDILIEAFKLLVKQDPAKFQDWQLVLVGGVEDKAYLRSLKQKAQGLKIRFYHQLPREKLVRLYQSAKLYWHAAGFEVDELKEPEKTEHFGITTIEAIAAGTVPLVVSKGGQAEILGQKLSQKLGWQTQTELVAKTLKLVQAKPTDYAQLVDQLQARLAPFNKLHFQQRVRQLFGL